MNYTDYTYFTGDIDITFENQDPTGFTRDYITPLEEEISVRVMGRKLYNESQAGIIEPTPDQKWLDLRDGVEFDVEFEGITYPVKWNGLQNTEKKSLLSYYIYAEWLSKNYKQLLGTGVAIAKKKNATTTDVREYILQSQSKAKALIGDYPVKSDKYQNVILIDDIDVDLIKIFEPTLFNFLYHKRADYPSWVFTPYEFGNYFDI